MTILKKLTFTASVLALAACSKSADKAVEAISAVPSVTPVTSPSTAPAVAKWNGPGTLQMTGMPDATCANVTAEILEDANGYDLQKFGYDCSGTTATMQEIRLELRAGDLYQGADKVGTKHDNVVEFQLADPSGANLGFQFTRVNDTLQTKHTLKANGFEQTLNATLKQ